MAILHPARPGPSQFPTDAERIMWDALSRLSDSWAVFHRREIDGQSIDFVVVQANEGVVVIGLHDVLAARLGNLALVEPAVGILRTGLEGHGLAGVPVVAALACPEASLAEPRPGVLTAVQLQDPAAVLTPLLRAVEGARLDPRWFADVVGFLARPSDGYEPVTTGVVAGGCFLGSVADVAPGLGIEVVEPVVTAADIRRALSRSSLPRSIAVRRTRHVNQHLSVTLRRARLEKLLAVCYAEPQAAREAIERAIVGNRLSAVDAPTVCLLNRRRFGRPVAGAPAPNAVELETALRLLMHAVREAEAEAKRIFPLAAAN